MKVKELIELLKNYNPELPIVVLDSKDNEYSEVIKVELDKDYYFTTVGIKEEEDLVAIVSAEYF